MRVALVANPKSGRLRGLKAAAIAEERFRTAGWTVVTKCTRCAGDAQRIAREAAQEGFDIVFACGGDGSVAEVVNGLVDTGVTAGVVPAGTGNDFARAIGLPLQPSKAVEQLVTGHEAKIDLLRVNDGALWSVNVMGMGLDARVAARINRRARLIGGLPAYLIALAQEFARYRPTDVRLQMGARQWEGRVILLAIANAVSYGAGMMISPKSKINDGLLDIVAVEYITRTQFALNFPRVLKGTHLSHPAIHHWQAASVQVVTDEPCPALTDGDVRCQTPLRVEAIHEKARFWMPPAYGTMSTPAPAEVRPAREIPATDPTTGA